MDEDELGTVPTEPGTFADLNHGLPGEPVEMPDDDADQDEQTGINDDEDEEDV